MAKYTIRLCNYSFTVSSDDDKTYMDNIAAKVERRVKRLSDEMPSRNMTEVALFVAMDYCDQYMKSVGDGSNLRGQIKDYLRESGYERKQLEETKKENELLKAEIEALRSRLSAKSAPAETAEENGSDIEPAPSKPVITKNKTDDVTNKTAEKTDSFSKSAPVQGFFSEDAFAESADAEAEAEIMSFFAQGGFDDDDDE